MKTDFALLVLLGVALVPGATTAQVPASQVILENPSVRVVVTTLAPGTGTGRHQGIEAEVGIVVDGDVSVESPLGRTALRPGSAYWLPGLTPHDTRNEGRSPARFYEIFLKRCD
ncbi:MAG: cupin domain-containing protein [Vicinamibacterales bacterium]